MRMEMTKTQFGKSPHIGRGGIFYFFAMLPVHISAEIRISSIFFFVITRKVFRLNFNFLGLSQLIREDWKRGRMKSGSSYCEMPVVCTSGVNQTTSNLSVVYSLGHGWQGERAAALVTPPNCRVHRRPWNLLGTRLSRLQRQTPSLIPKWTT